MNPWVEMSGRWHKNAKKARVKADQSISLSCEANCRSSASTQDFQLTHDRPGDEKTAARGKSIGALDAS